MLHTPGETDDQITVWLPEKRVVLPADNIYKSFPNLYAIRGSQTRDANQWVQSLDRVRELKAEYMVPSHTEAVIGEDKIEDILVHYRDGIQYVHDQTVRWLNYALTPDEIIEKVILPPKLSNHEYLQEFYGTVAWSVRGIFETYLGWFDGKPENLYPLSQKDHFQKLARLLESGNTGGNGNSRLVADAEKSLWRSMENLRDHNLHLTDELQWALELSSGVVAATDPTDPDHKRAKATEIKCLRELASSTSNANSRNYYLTYANELEQGFTAGPSDATLDMAKLQLDVENIMINFRYRLRAEECDDSSVFVVVFAFTDVNRTFSYKLRHCVFESRTDPEEPHPNADATLTLPLMLYRRILRKEAGFLSSYMNGDLKLEGSLLLFKKFIGLNSLS